MKLPKELTAKVYICSPFRPVSNEPEKAAEEKQRNIKLAQIACGLVTELGMMPIAPHLFFPQFLDDDDPDDREKGMLLGREQLSGCDELWVFGDRISEGMEAEIKQAREANIRVRYCRAPLDMYLRLIEFGEELCLKDLKWEDNRTFSFAGRVGKFIGVAPEDVYQ